MVLRPHQTKLRASTVDFEEIKSALFAEAQVNKGVITMIDSDDIPNGALQVGKNVFIRFDRTMRRYGGVPLSPNRPDTLPVLGLSSFLNKSGSAWTFRFTRGSVYSKVGANWFEVSGTLLLGSDADRIRTVNVLDKFIFSNNGANKIQIIDPTLLTHIDLGNAPAYRYITGFYNRAVGAALRGISEVQVGWSADGVITEWDPSVNRTAGSSDILDSPGDLSDPISGIFGFTNVMVLMRQKSVWLATKQPIPTNPFYFYAAFPGIGCDCPDTIAVVPNGLAWLDINTGTVWLHTPGSEPLPIGRPIEATIIKGVDDPLRCFGSYNAKHAEYTLCIPRASSTLVTTWTYNFRTQAWAEGEYSNITSLNDLTLSDIGGGLTIDELAGIIDDLVGTIDSLSPSSTTVNSRVFGMFNGDIMLEDETALLDIDRTYMTEIVSKSFAIPEDDMYIMELRIEFIKRAAGSMVLYQSKNGGHDFVVFRSIADSYLVSNRPQIVKINVPLKARRYAWRIIATTGLFEILNYSIKVTESGASRAPGR